MASAKKGSKRGTKRARSSSQTTREASLKSTGKRPAKGKQKTKALPKSKHRRATKATKARAPQVTKDSIVCGAHGETPATFACQHLAGGSACGFHANPPADDDLWPDAWCDLCEEAFQAAGGEWNDESQEVADIKVLCTHCYEAARERNSGVPDLARGRATRLTKDEASQLFHHAVHEAQSLQEESDKRWGWRTMPRWDLNYESSTLTFSDPKRGSIVADVRLVGSYSTKSSTFQWAWETLGEHAGEAEEISRLRVFGDVRGISELTTPNWECDEEVAWKMTSLAAYILGAESVYAAPSDYLRWFMLLSNWRKPN